MFAIHSNNDRSVHCRITRRKTKSDFAIKKIQRKNLPKGFTACMGYGMIAYVIPHTMYPAGYHGNPKDPVPLMNLASQKNFVAVYSTGVCGDPKLLKCCTEEYVKAGVGKLYMERAVSG